MTLSFEIYFPAEQQPTVPVRQMTGRSVHQEVLSHCTPDPLVIDLQPVEVLTVVTCSPKALCA